ncbi:Piso0_004548 [Millerozyma farinosa CBS 7064]|uniref:RNA helicase n=1 Tax=Pichia sorbitophila (strain ATCC MYA-4447 / BCRC 22081 / CBS 7064 / NBRC 10061 / NRRL Y-12695) TaxID=559304 RepID=G8Y5S1_PICSO|nr:Piso0_004548 [Millerozyma farinosa CBS 7064]CCE84982.1 Piso0_004548 [Millerozyma farinosa CBS 7064]
MFSLRSCYSSRKEWINISFVGRLAGISRSYVKASKKKAGQVIKTRRGKQLEAASQPKAFGFGNFSKLHAPKETLKEISENAIKNISSFESLRIFPSVRAAMIEEIKEKYDLKNTYVKGKSELEIKPSPIQVAAIKKINQPRLRNVNNVNKAPSNDIYKDIKMNNEAKRLKIFTIAAETGSGKTWAYLAPVLSKLKEDDLASYAISETEYQKEKNSQTIRCLILVPTHELVEQVYECVRRASTVPFDVSTELNEKQLKDPVLTSFLQREDQAESLNLNVAKWSAGDPHTRLFDMCKKRVDVLVTTPAKVQGLAKLNNVPRPFRYINQIEYCVIDEADTLMDSSWSASTLGVVRHMPRCKDLIFCSATIPREFNRTLQMVFPDKNSLIHVVTPSIHKIPKKIELKIIDAQLSPYNGSKTRCLAQALYAINKDGTEQGYVKRVIVFVNEKKDVEPLAETLIHRFGHRKEDIVGVTGSQDAEERAFKLESFLQPAQRIEDDPYNSKIRVLVTTDLLARGLNFTGVKNVILMDLPRTSVDLVHRVGRTGRMRQSGRVFIIIDKKTGKSWIKGLPKIVKRGIPLA